jgi:hypothetical protein
MMAIPNGVFVTRAEIHPTIPITPTAIPVFFQPQEAVPGLLSLDLCRKNKMISATSAAEIAIINAELDFPKGS